MRKKATLLGLVLLFAALTGFAGNPVAAQDEDHRQDDDRGQDDEHRAAQSQSSGDASQCISDFNMAELHSNAVSRDIDADETLVGEIDVAQGNTRNLSLHVEDTRLAIEEIEVGKVFFEDPQENCVDFQGTATDPCAQTVSELAVHVSLCDLTAVNEDRTYFVPYTNNQDEENTFHTWAQLT